MLRSSIMLVLFGLTAPASAEPAWSVHLGESVGLEDGMFGPVDVVTTDLAVARRVRGGWWVYASGRTGSASSGCDSCITTTGTLREARLGGMHLWCMEDDLVCAGVSAGVGYQHRVMPDPVEYGNGPATMDTYVEEALVGDARGHLQVSFARDFPIAVEASVGTRYLSGLGGSEFPAHVGFLASLGLVARM